jgi:hypothetical protein
MGMSICLIAVEGVLGEHSNIHGFHPIGDGVKLAKALRSEYQLVLSSTAVDDQAVEHWLRINGMTTPGFYEGLFYQEDRWADLTEDSLMVRHAGQLRSNGANVSLVVSSNPEAVLLATEAGFPSLFFVNPSYRWAEYRPDNKRLPKPWQDIDDEMIRQRELKAVDPRLNEMEPETA